MQPRFVVPAIGILGFALIGTGVAHAGTVAGSATLVSDYVFRGVSQTNQDPAVQAGIEWAADSGFYVGSWGSNISWLSDLSTDDFDISSSVELDFYAGYRGQFSDAVKFDASVLYYWYPGDFPSDFNSADTVELAFGITWSLLTAKVYYAPTDLFGYADSDGSVYVDLALNWEFVPTWTLNAHVGRQWIENNGDYDYTDWKLGVTKGFANGFSVALAYVDTNADEDLYTNPRGNFIADATAVLTLGKAW